MQRSIKFRAKGVDGEWWYGSLNPDPLTYRQIHLGKFFTLLKDGALLPETVGQFTGLKDKNGKEIYEGDIIKIEDGDFEVCFLELCWYLRGVSPTSLSFGRLYETWNEAHKKNLLYEVIGNIYENPELLK